jgi:hypothetical protein
VICVIGHAVLGDSGGRSVTFDDVDRTLIRALKRGGDR